MITCTINFVFVLNPLKLYNIPKKNKLKRAWEIFFLALEKFYPRFFQNMDKKSTVLSSNFATKFSSDSWSDLISGIP